MTLRTALLLAAALQLAFGLSTFGRWPPVADGTFYHLFAERLAAGQGYTMAWPDGAVTYAAHFPVGYPLLLSALYAVFGAHPGLAWVLGAGLHLAASYALARMVGGGAAGGSSRLQPWVLLLHALHPALFFYTPALMTEALTGNLWVLAVWALMHAQTPGSNRAFAGWVTLAGGVLGLATLMRPQSIVLALALALAWWLWRLPRRRFSVLLVLVPLLVCAPWTARNCVRMNQCALVSVNGGWNLLIGAHTESGAWEPLQVPGECREVWDEAEKDRCFGAVARREIGEAPWRWLSRVPAKARATFDYFGAAPYTLHEANPQLLSARGKLWLAVTETVWQRLLLLAAALGWWLRAPRAWPRPVRLGCAALLALSSLLPWGASLALLGIAALSLQGRRPSWPQLATAAVIASTLLMHAVFFGGGRYGLVVVPWVVLAVAQLGARAPRATASPSADAGPAATAVLP